MGGKRSTASADCRDRPRRACARGAACARRGVALACAATVAALCVVWLSACGGGLSADAVVVSVGPHAISKASVDHWTAVIERGGAFSGFRGAPAHGTPRRRALALLISSNWLIGEAARQGVTPPESVVRQDLSEREQSPEFHKLLRKSAQTVADVKLEMTAELAGEAIRHALARRAARFSAGEVAAFYRANEKSYSSLEERVTDLLENQPSAAAASALVRRIGTGPRFRRLAYHELVSRTPGFLRTPEKVKVVDAIFAARPGVLSAPMMLNHSWAVFVVRKVIPPRPLPLAKVHSEVLTRFDVARQHQIADEFDREYTARWKALTHCRSGYVGPGCPQLTAALEPYEDPFSRRAHPLLSEQTGVG